MTTTTDTPRTLAIAAIRTGDPATGRVNRWPA